MAKVSVVESGPVAGIWVEDAAGRQAGLIAQDGVGVYVAFYNDTRSLPLAVGAMDSGVDVVQIPLSHGGLTGAKTYTLDQILAVLATLPS